MSVTISVKTEERRMKALDQLAAIEETDRDTMINDAIDQRLEHDQWQWAKILEGMAQSDRGQTLSTAELRVRLQAKGIPVNP